MTWHGPHFPKSWSSKYGDPPPAYWFHSKRRQKLKTAYRNMKQRIQSRSQKRKDDYDDQAHYKRVAKRRKREADEQWDRAKASIKRKSTTQLIPSKPAKKSFLHKSFHLATNVLSGGAAVGTAIATQDLNKARDAYKATQYIGGKLDSSIFPSHDLPSKKSTTYKMSAINQTAHRVGMTRKGSKNSRVARKKSVYVPKNLRKQIKQINKTELPIGIYHEINSGTIGMLNASVPVAPSVSINSINALFHGTNSSIVYLPPTLLQQTCWWGGSVPTSSTFGQRSTFTYFAPYEILEAASCLFNSKPLPTSEFYPYTFSDLLDVGIDSTGDGVVDTLQFDGLKLEVKDAYVTWEMKNNSSREVTVDLYHLTLKNKFMAPQHSVGHFIDAMLAQLDTGSARLENGPLETMGPKTLRDTNSQINALLCNPMFEPNMCPKFNTYYKYEKITMVIKGGETCKHSIQGPKNYILDYKKLFLENSTQVDKLYKPTTLQVLVRCRPDMQFCSTGVDSTSGGGTAFTNNGTAGVPFKNLGNLSLPISLQIARTYKIRCPDIAGLTFPSVTTGGSTGRLTMRVPRRILLDFRQYVNDTVTWKPLDEENPGEQIAAPVVTTN